MKSTTLVLAALGIVALSVPLNAQFAATKAGSGAESKDRYAGKWFRLKTQFTGPGQCLEGNRRGGSEKNGNAYMTPCQDVSGQLWKLERQPDGNYRLKTQFRGEGECLEGNSAGKGAFMDKCQNVTGQLWRITPAGNGYVRLQNLMGDNSLEGNRSDLPGAGGAAFMDTKQDVTGQLWKLTEAK